MSNGFLLTAACNQCLRAIHYGGIVPRNMIDAAVGANLTRVRSRNGLSTGLCAKLAGMSPRQLALCEAGWAHLPADKIIRLCQQLGLTPATFMIGLTNDSAT